MGEGDSPVFEREVRLRFRIGSGWLGPHLAALGRCEALGRKCGKCGDVSFPPVRVCDCGSPEGEWVPLDGTAEVIARTDGADGSFALVRFAGATCNSVACLHGLPVGSAEGVLVPHCGELPHICLGPREQENK